MSNEIPIKNQNHLNTFSDERAIKDFENRRYKEDLDFLVSIKRRKDENDSLIKEKEKRDFNHNAGILRDEEAYRNNKYDNINRNILINNMDCISSKKEQLLKNKISSFKEESSFLDYLNQIKFMEDRKKEDEKNAIRNYKLLEYQNHLKNKQVQNEKRMEGFKENKDLINNQIRRSIERENEYKSKINMMNNRIFDNVNKYNEYLNKSPIKENSSYIDGQINGSDLLLNKQLAEMRKESPMLKEERIKDRQKNEENYQTMINRAKSENDENKKLYRGFLDYQIITKNQEFAKSPKSEMPQTILPSYFHENRPIATYKKAADTISLMKRIRFDKSFDSLEKTKFTKNTHWETKLAHNPITHPLLDINYNKYLTKSLSLKRSNENMDLSPIQNVANVIIN